MGNVLRHPIGHLVVFKLHDNSAKAIDFMLEQLSKLKALPYGHELSLATKLIKSDIEGDVVLFAQYPSEDMLNGYMKDPLHLAVIAATSPNIKSKATVDFHALPLGSLV